MSERSLLADAVASFFADRCTPDHVADFEAGADTAELWAELEELGLTRASVPEAFGGTGGTLVDALTVLRAAGRASAPLPLAETDVLAGWLLSEAGLALPPGPLTVAPVDRRDELRLSRDGDGARISGLALRVPFARAVEHVVVLARADDGVPFVATVPRSALAVAPYANLAGEPRDGLRFDGVRVAADAFARSPHGAEALLLRGALTRAVLMLGGLERTRDLAVEYVQERVQFGRALARFQAVQHLIAMIARDVAVTRAAVDLAVSAALERPDGGWLETAAAKVVAGRTVRTVAAQAHQVHGAIGVTREYPLSVVTRRLWCWRDEFGDEAAWSRLIGARAWAAEGGVWPLVADGRMPLELAQTA
jgi:acyl-CoA dehydrogenase